MSNSSRQQVVDLLNDDEEIQLFAALNRMSVDSAHSLLSQVIENQELDALLSKYIFADDQSDGCKAYVAGEAHGYLRGHEAGFTKGMLVSIFAAVAVAAIVWVVCHSM